MSALILVKMFSAYLPKFTSNKKRGGYSVYSYFRIASIEGTLNYPVDDDLSKGLYYPPFEKLAPGI